MATSKQLTYAPGVIMVRAHITRRTRSINSIIIASVFSAKSRTWFELFFIPLIPMNTKHIWMCGICRWVAPMGPGQWEPPIAYQNPQQNFGHMQGRIPSNGFQQGYQPSYDQPPNNYPPNQK
ncbi:MAG: hypothetical protein NXY57DRAFT_964196 [Lentinula lateritia]|nr:MAG: hypothetical protein NXY57DRAFT_964196 [Lentinula lateritia]